MIVRFDIKLDGPICNCNSFNGTWGTTADGLNWWVKCLNCGVCHQTPVNKTVGSFSFNKPYPNKPEPKPDINELRLKEISNMEKLPFIGTTLKKVEAV